MGERANGAVRAAVAVLVTTGAIAGAVALDMRAGEPKAAIAVPIPARIDGRSSAEDVMRFAESSGGRWRALRVRGRQGSAGAGVAFDTVVAKPGRSRSVEAGMTRVRNGARSLRTDEAARSASRSTAPAASPGLQARMAVHRAEDPTLARDGERLLDTPVNDLVSPAGLIRRELRMAAVAVRTAGERVVAGRRAVVLEARFPAELAKEDHWDVLVDVETGVLLGLVIEPLPGEMRFESIVEELEVDPVIADGLFDTTVPAGYAEAAR